jgi:hypothetical protein
MAALPGGRRTLSSRSGPLSVAAALVVLVPGLSACPPIAQAERLGAINGVFTAFSNGDWAKTGGVAMDEQSVVSTWTISTTCSMYHICEGAISSDQGWAATISTTNALWYVRRELPGRQPCPDGTAATGHQMFRFYPVDPQTGQMMPGSDIHTGLDRTAVPGGSCGVSTPVVIEMPFRLTRIS